MHIRRLVSLAALTAAFGISVDAGAARLRVGADMGVAFAGGAFGEHTDPAVEGTAGVGVVIPTLHLSAGVVGGRRNFHSISPLHSTDYRFDLGMSWVGASLEYSLFGADSTMRPVVGLDAGWGWFEYSWSQSPLGGGRSDSGLVLAPRAGVRAALGSAFDLFLMLRYESLDTGTINYGDSFVASKVTGVGFAVGASYTFGS